MMQALLAERFRLAVHRESKDLDALALLVGPDGPKLRRADAPGNYRTGGVFRGGGRIEAEGMSMPLLASVLTNTLGRPVVDLTGLSGDYRFSLDYAAYEAAGATTIVIDGARPPNLADPDTGVSVFSSIQKLGLRLDRRKLPLPVIVVDHAKKKPDEN